MANLKAGTLIGGNLIWNAGNLPLRTSAKNLYIEDEQVYTTAFKPTPADVNAVAKSGDTMTGDLTLKKSSPEIWLHGDSNSANCGKVYFVEGTNKDHGGWMGYDGDANRMNYGHRANGSNSVVFYHAYNSNTVFFNGSVLTNASQNSDGRSFTRKDYVDAEDAKRVAKAGDTMTGRLVLNYTSSMRVPVGTNDQRGSSETGSFRFNTTETSFEGYDGAEWQPIGSGRVKFTQVTANTTAKKGKGYLVDTTKSGIVVTLPADANDGDFVVIGDGAGNANKNVFYVDGYNGDRIIIDRDNCMLRFSKFGNKWVISDGVGEAGALDTASYLKKDGDTINGDLKFAPGKKIVLPTTDWATGATIEALPAGDGFGSNLNISSGGNTVLGAGESANNLRDLTNGENLFLTADGSIELITGGNTWADRKTALISNTGDMSLNRTSTAARFYLGNNSKTYVARSGTNVYLAANEDNGKVYIEGKTNPVARVNGTDHEIYHKGNKPTPSDIGAPKCIGSWGTGTAAEITTADFIKLLSDKGAFKERYWIARGEWTYANNKTITDTGCGNIHLSGCVIEVFTGSETARTIRITTPSTSSNGGTVNAEFIYIDNGSTYLPGWRRQYNTTYKPSASDVGALPLSGGTLTGNLKISGNDKSLAIGVGGSDVYVSNTKTSKYLQLKDDGTLQYDNKKVYYEGFKPTAADVGAIQEENIGGVPDHVQAVILLHPISGAASNYNYFFGQVKSSRHNGNNPTYAFEVNTQKRYNSETSFQGDVISIGESASNVYLASCMYNGVRYLALHWYLSSAQIGSTFITGRWSNKPIIVQYYNINTSAVLNAEVKDSLTKLKDVHIPYTNLRKPSPADLGALSTSGGTFSGDLISSSRNGGNFGTYDSTKTDQVWSMGASYRNSADGSNFGNLYGLAYKHTNNATGGYMAGGHQIVMCENGTPKSALGQHVWSSGRFISAGTGNTFEAVGGFLRSNTAQVMSLDGKTYSFVTSPMDAHLCYNSYWDGSTWKKYDDSKTSGYVVVNSIGLRYMQSPAGSSNPNQVAREIATYEKAVATFYSNWSNYSNGYDELSITKNGSMVALAGLVKKHADGGDYICTLPEGYRPRGRKIFLCGCNGGFIRIDVETNGVVSRGSFGGGESTVFGAWTSLEAIRFSVL